VLSDVLDSEEARGVRRIVTDDINDVREGIASLGRRVGLICIYGGDGTIFRVINELLRETTSPPPRLAFLGGGTMNVTAGWCGMRHSPGENFRRIMRAHRSDSVLWRETPVLQVKQGADTQYGFSFVLGPLVRLLNEFEQGEKSKTRALTLGVQSIASALSGIPRDRQSLLTEMKATLTVDGRRIPFERFAAVVANITGMINPFVQPFVRARAHDSLNFLAYAISSREFALMAPLLARALLPLEPRALLTPISTWRRALLSFLGEDGLPLDERYFNDSARTVRIETSEARYTIDGEIFSTSGTFDLGLGPTLSLATL